MDIKARGQRVFVSDVQESLFVLRYKRHENQLIIFVDDTNQRWVTTSCLLDYDTAAVADKFGNIAVVSICKLRFRWFLYAYVKGMYDHFSLMYK